MYSAISVMSAPGGLLAGGLGGGGVSRAEPVLLVSERPVPARRSTDVRRRRATLLRVRQLTLRLDYQCETVRDFFYVSVCDSTTFSIRYYEGRKIMRIDYWRIVGASGGNSQGHAIPTYRGVMWRFNRKWCGFVVFFFFFFSIWEYERTDGRNYICNYAVYYISFKITLRYISFQSQISAKCLKR